MQPFVLALIVCAAICLGQGCGSPSPAALDCQEFNRYTHGVWTEMQKSGREVAPIALAPEVCIDWIETTSTRCQQVFCALAACSRNYSSMEDVTEACLSEFLEVSGACVLPL